MGEGGKAMTQRWKGRRPVLTVEQVAELKAAQALRASMPTNADLARRFGVSRSAIDCYLKANYIPKRHEVQT